jgi:hypothetical protein
MVGRLTVLSIVFATTLASPAAAGREDQWIFRQELGDGSLQPSAVFLASDYSAVLFRATCDPARHELVLDYFGDGEVRLSARNTMTLRRASSIPLRTRLINGHLEGRVKATRELLRVLSEPGELQIDAPNAEEEPWYVGVAEPLLRVARDCP